MNRVFLIRHGENQANLTKQFSYRLIDYPLNAKGILQARQTAEALAGRGIEEVYASPLRRASQTAQIIAQGLGLAYTEMEDFREVNTGDLEKGPPSAEAWATHNRIFSGWLDGHPETPMPGGENYFSLWGRLQAGLHKILDGRDGKTVLIAGHGGMFTVTLPQLCPGIDRKQVLGRESHNCSITEVLLENRAGAWKGQLVAWAEAGHLYGEAARLVSGYDNLEL